MKCCAKHRFDAKTLSGKKHPRRLPKQQAPTRIEEQYAKALVRLVLGEFRKAYAKLIEEAPKLAQAKLDEKQRTDAYNPDEPRDEDGRWAESDDEAPNRFFKSPRQQAVDYLKEGGFERLASNNTKSGERYHVFGAKNGAYSVRRAKDLHEIGTAYLANAWDENGRSQGLQNYLSIVKVDPEYRRQGIATTLYNAIEKHIGRPLIPSPIDLSDDAKALWKARRAVRTDSPESRKIQSLVSQAAQDFKGRTNKPQIANLAKRFGQQTDTFQRIQLNNQVKDVLGVDVPVRDPEVADRTADFVRQNVALVSSIPQDLHSELETMVHHAVVRGRPNKDLSDDIERRFGVAENRARLIARDQIGKLYADINRHRQRRLGVQKFIWRTMKDERVRGDPDGKYPNAQPSHYALEGLMFSYDDPPVPEGADEPLLPGEDYQCRCYAEPVLDDLLGDDDDDDEEGDDLEDEGDDEGDDVEEGDEDDEGALIPDDHDEEDDGEEPDGSDDTEDDDVPDDGEEVDDDPERDE